MHKKIGLAVMVILLAAGMTGAQDLTGKFCISPSGGVGIPTGFFAADLQENSMYRTTGFIFGAGADYFFTPYLGAGVDFFYASFGAKEYSGITLDDKFNFFKYGVHLKGVLPLEGKARPYAIASFGMVSPKWKDFGVEGSEIPIQDVKIDAAFYFTGTLGAMYFVTPTISVFLEGGGSYLMLENAESETEIDGEIVKADFGENVTFIDIRAGVSFWFGVSE